MRDGVSASRTWLPKPGSDKSITEVYGEWHTILDFLIDRFPFISEAIFRERMLRGDIVDQDGQPYHADSLYRAETFLFYYREIPDEPAIPFKEDILFHDKNIIVVDKPHFIPVTPTGRYVKESLLSRLKHQFQLEEISPIHRLDRETAGVILFSCNEKNRGAYQNLFQNREVEKSYEAIAPTSSLAFPLTHSSRMTKGDPFFLMQEVDGEANSKTVMDMIETKDGLSRYLLKPVSGKQHQLRVHMASIGSPILNDPFYPVLEPSKGEDYSSPLQLLAKTISFTDPITGKEQHFESRKQLIL
ncbi:pseudouridine synthase [Leucothrix arctica]|uniref:Pseudouridine synthase n=2 Tax=Leucothrix arctica TaxID=1481894 RepID=A0A317CM96_9GAMM|nr:pseudouridine synthase [Leucothrix arctica]